ncbi:Uncharacterised protein [Urinicoccus massiliensis]|uniref:Uncharacterized protein n=1 Tax=Urinicoccus massiliensis TaxID=1723382 RepID=A0A8H2M3Z2_9FIRM|nr:hypothetical protein [Urinicoccus massiliensis]VFB16104.1 Uncharacterised protein [Urinicoccus massiliensis]
MSDFNYEEEIEEEVGEEESWESIEDVLDRVSEMQRNMEVLLGKMQQTQMELEERELEDERVRCLAAEILSFYKSGDFEDVFALEDGNDSEPSEDSEILDGHGDLYDFSLVEDDEFQNEDNDLSPDPEETDPSQSQEIMLASNLPEEGQEKKGLLDIIVILIGIVCAISELVWFVFVIIRYYSCYPVVSFWFRQKKIIELIGQA